MAARGDRYERGTGIVIACAADRSAEQATQRVRLELHDPDRWLLWVPYEHVLPHLDASWVADFRRRYLEFTPVADLLAADDLRVSRSQPESWLSGIADARALAERVCGEGSVLAQILEAHSEGRLRSASSAHVEALDARAAELAVDLRTLREAAYQLWSQIDEQDRA